MVTSLHRWEADPLFSAAEIIQDSADRTESAFRFLLHEQSLVQGDHPDPKLLSSIAYHRRDLATTLETTKWQLEDFEREVTLSAVTDKSQTRENVISRHKQFINAIREQINHVEKCLAEPSVGYSGRNTEWVYLNEQDRDGLALFLSGGNTIEHTAPHKTEDTNVMRFFGPNAPSRFNSEIVEHNSDEVENSCMNGIVHMGHSFDSEDYKLRKGSFHHCTHLGFESPSSRQETACDGRDEDGSWDMEANEDKAKSFFKKNKLSRCYSRLNVFGSLGNLWSTYGSSTSRNSIKRQKDGEDQRHPQSYIDASRPSRVSFTQMQLASGYSTFRGLCLDLFARLMYLCRSLYHVQVDGQAIKLISAILFTLVVLGILALQVA